MGAKVHGRTIELEQEPQLPDGQRVSVQVHLEEPSLKWLERFTVDPSIATIPRSLRASVSSKALRCLPGTWHVWSRRGANHLTTCESRVVLRPGFFEAQKLSQSLNL
jgi:hypothetical protein